MSINRVVLVGRLTRDPELRNTTTGKQVVNFGLAVDDRFNRDNTNFFNISAWGSTADFVAKYLTKGRLIAVDGRLQQRKYTTQDGQERNVVEIVADTVQGLDRPRDDAGSDRGGQPEPVSVAPADDEYDPFADE
ncbi:MAG TPA: single-stranded DNA-binding protein [Fimbriimonadaceae bacterium]|nr:single-stranded DNA-binding protein [Fimbriimonadaceae bacterium]